MNLLDQDFIQKASQLPNYKDTSIGNLCKRRYELKDHINQLEYWYSFVPEHRAKDVLNRFRSTDERPHWSAFWEMGIANYFRDDAFDITWGIDGEPDLWLRKHGYTYAVEIRGLYRSDEEMDQERLMKQLVAKLNQINSPVALSVFAWNKLSSDIDPRQMALDVETWVNRLSQSDLQTKCGKRLRYSGSEIRIETLPGRNVGTEGIVAHHSVYMAMNRDNDVKRILSKKRKQSRHYKCSLELENIPLIIALGDSSRMSINETAIKWALFGKETLSWMLNNKTGRISGETRWGRDGRGYVVPKKFIMGPQNTWLSGVFFFTEAWNGSTSDLSCKLYTNHWARFTIPDDTFSCSIFRAKKESDTTVTYGWFNTD